MQSLFRLLAALLIGFVLIAPARAQTGTITVVKSEAQPDFPTAIRFGLVAEAASSEIVAVQLLYGAARSEAMTVVDLAVTPGRRVTLEHNLDTQVYHMPPGTALRYEWVIRDSAGQTITSKPQDLVYHDQRFAWSELSERNVSVFWYEGGEAFGKTLLATATKALDELGTEIGADLDLPVRIYVYANNRDMRSALQSNSVEWVGGEAQPALGIIVGAITPDDTAEIGRLVPHELSHQVLYQATENPYGGVPTWFNEGLAVHNQQQRDVGWDKLVTAAAEEGRLIPLEALAASFPADTDQALLSYAQSRDVVEYIINKYGDAKLTALVESFAQATPPDEALTKVLGRTVDELDADWRATLPRQTQAAPVLSSPQTAPADRFEAAPPAPAGAQKPAWTSWFAGLPGWMPLAATAFCCVAGVGIAGTLLLVSLRMAGVDKRTS